MELIVEGRGIFLGKHQGRLRVSREGKTVQEAPLIHLQQVIVVGNGVSVSSDVIRVCADEGIPIHFLEETGTPLASLYAAGLTGTVMTRRAQILAYTDRLGVQLARLIVCGKIANQRALLRYIAKYRKETAPELFEWLQAEAAILADHTAEAEAIDAPTIDAARERFMSVEGRAASRYWGAIARIIPAELAWPGRETRGAPDIFNMALNYGYGVLYSQVERVLVLAGLDPYAGFLHADRPGKFSMVCDLIELFRQPVVDRTIIGMVNRGIAFETEDDGRFNSATRKRIAEKILERMESTELYEGKRQPVRCILQSEARHIATFVRGDLAVWQPFVMGW